MQTRDIVVIGASMGGIQTLSALAAQLPPDLPAAVLVVQHLAEESPGVLAEILEARGPLRAVTAVDGMALERGCIYVAPPNRHMLATEKGLRVAFGPRENLSRPAIDPLFRTAAVHYRSRVVGLVLTGLLGDGSAGLYAVARCGGVALVQSPADALFSEMPERARERVPSARAVTVREAGAVLDRLCREAAPPAPSVPETLLIEVRLTERAMGNEDWHEVPGEPTNFTCPACAGAIEEIEEEGAVRYRCRVGHAYSPADWLKEKGDAVEATLWVALQTLSERAEMLSRMAREDAGRGRSPAAEGYERRARETRAHADRLRALLQGLPV